MANKIFHSSTVTFLDRTDERKLEVYIGSNHPTVQIKNQNTNEYTPDWGTTNLQLSADVYVDSQEITTDSQTSVSWYAKIDNMETIVGTGSTLTIDTNVLSANPIITYVCRATYQNLDALSQITFTRSDTGLNGKDGTSIIPKGTATSVAAIPETDYYTITYEGSDVSTAQLYDSYLYDGNLYVCIDSRDGVDYFMNVGNIQGPKGDDAKNIVLSGSSQVFKVGKANDITPATITVTAIPINTVVSKWLYRINSVATWVEIENNATVLGGVSRNGNVITITGANLTSSITSITLKATDDSVEDVFTIYKAFDGTDGSAGRSASMAFLTNENISFSADASGQVALTSFTTNVVAYDGAEKVTPTLGAITGLPAGMTVADPVIANNEQVLAFSITNNATLGSDSSNYGLITIPVTYPVKTNLILSWSKINTGATGTPGTSGLDAVTFQVYSNNGYAISTNVPTVTLQAFSYIGSVAITAGATYQWYTYGVDSWVVLSGATNSYLTINREDVSFSRSYMCKMTFNGAEYTSVVTIDDKNDENKVFTNKPSNYSVGDLWIVGADYVPSGVETGTMLKAEHTNTEYDDADWIPATKYDEKIASMQSNIDTYNQYFSFDSTDGLKISARDANGKASKFSTSLTNERLSFNYGNESIAYISGTKMNIKEAEIESPLTVTGKYSGSTMLQAPVINIGNFSIIVESNGSLSIVANT